MLGQRRKRLADVVQMLLNGFMFAGLPWQLDTQQYDLK